MRATAVYLQLHQARPLQQVGDAAPIALPRQSAPQSGAGLARRYRLSAEQSQSEPLPAAALHLQLWLSTPVQLPSQHASGGHKNARRLPVGLGRLKAVQPCAEWPHPQRLSPCLHSAPQTAATPSRRLAAGRDRLRHCAASCLLSWDASLPQGLLVAEARRDALQHRCDGVCPAGGR